MTKDEAESLQLKVLAEVFDEKACATLLELIDKATEIPPILDEENGRVWRDDDGNMYTYTQHDWRCPKCGAVVGERLTFSEREKTFIRLKRNKSKRAYCNCGQAILWESEE